VTDNFIYLNQPTFATVTGAVGDGVHVVYTTADPHTFAQNEIVTISGMNPATFDQTNVTITAITSNTFTIASTNTDTFVAGGTAEAKVSATPDVGFVAEYFDTTEKNAGFFRDADDGAWKVFDGYTLDPSSQVFIDTTDPSFSLADFGAAAITATGDVTANEFNSTSDVRAKTNIEDLDSAEVLKSLRPVSFDWKESGKKAYGFIAQEVEEILPELVSTDSKDMKSMSYSQIIPFLVKEIVLLREEINRLNEK